jgi:hypothetical protein
MVKLFEKYLLFSKNRPLELLVNQISLSEAKRFPIFVRKDMKKIYLLLSLIFTMFGLFGFSAKAALSQESQLLAGSEKVKFEKNTETAKCFVFNQYIIKTNSGEDVGEDISIYKRGDKTAATNGCPVKSPLLFTIKNPDSNYFLGLAGDFLFIDSGTGPDSRGLEIYNLKSRKSIFTSEYHDSIKLITGDTLRFDKISGKNGLLKNCKQAAKIKRDGMSVGWVQDTQLNLKTLKASSVGALRCVALQ